jgi:hypothetical protein
MTAFHRSVRGLRASRSGCYFNSARTINCDGITGGAEKMRNNPPNFAIARQKRGTINSPNHPLVLRSAQMKCAMSPHPPVNWLAP